jgi:two-component system sensor histidine kinase TctE
VAGLTRSSTLRTRLLQLLGWPLLVLLLLSGAYDYYRALDRARDNQDLALSRVAIALASRLDVDADDSHDDLGPHLSRTMIAMQREDGQDRLSFMVRMQDQTLIGGDAALAALANPAALRTATYADRQTAGHQLRVVTYPHQSPLGPVTVVVAETTQRREAQARLVLADTVLPNMVLLALTLALVRIGVHLAMRPLDQLGASVAIRAPEDLSPVPIDRLPGELLPLVQAINRLMTHLRASAESQQTFLSNAAHQLRTPLAGIQTQIELASREADAVQRERLAAIQAALQRMGRSTHQMLALARSGPQAVQAESFQPIDLQPLIEDAASIWLDPALSAQVDLGFETEPTWISGSAWMLQELLGNLIDNAIRHCPPGGRVTVRCGASPDRWCWLIVEDDGPGLPLIEQARVFDRFYRAPGAVQGGSGLGLAIVREVVLRHAGQVMLGDGPNGKGLQVRIRFTPLD